jgi:hypothetical protein
MNGRVLTWPVVVSTNCGLPAYFEESGALLGKRIGFTHFGADGKKDCMLFCENAGL